MLEKDVMYKMLEGHPEYKELLFCKGYLITDNHDVDSNLFPFSYSHWTCEHVDNYDIWHDNRLPLISSTKDNQTIFLLGHAFNPFTMEIDEQAMLDKLITLEGNDFWEYESQFTGVYMMGIISGNTIRHWVDCAGMLIAYYGQIDNHYYITSHTKIVGDWLNLKEDEYITKLKNYRFFKIYGCKLPADSSPFFELKRTVPNHQYFYKNNCIDVKRFYPMNKIDTCSDESYVILCNDIAKVFKATLKCCSEKWKNRIAISVTGGCDSAMTLAAANGVYDRFKYFSYSSKPEEQVDVEAAKTICNGLGVDHTTYSIDCNNKTEEWHALNSIITYNLGNIIDIKESEIGKRLKLLKISDFDVEVKSWIGEIGRAYQYKRLNKKKFSKKPSARKYTSLYKIFLFNRGLVKQTDKCFEDFINEYVNDEDQLLFPEWPAMYEWEFNFGVGEGAHLIAEHMLSHDVTIPFNNRRLAFLMSMAPLKKRISDSLQSDIILINNEEIFKMNVRVQNVAHTLTRSIVEQIYYEIQSILPF